MAIVSINMNSTTGSIPDVIQHMIVIRNLVRRLFVKKTAPSSRWRRHGASFASNGAPSANDGAAVTSGGARLGGDGALSPVTAPLSPVTSGRRPRRSGCAPQRNDLVLWEFLRTPLAGAPGEPRCGSSRARWATSALRQWTRDGRGQFCEPLRHLHTPAPLLWCQLLTNLYPVWMDAQVFVQDRVQWGRF